MTQDIQMARAMNLPAVTGGPATDDWSQGGYPGGGTALGAPMTGGAGGAQTMPNPLKRVQRLLRGRILLAFVLAVVCGLAGAAAGYMIPKPYYQSFGLLRIEPVQKNPLGNDTVMPMYYQYVASQVALMKSQRVVAQALNSNEWKSVKHNPAADPMAEFQANLDVEAARDSYLVSVSYADLDPQVAQAAVKAVLTAYDTLYNEMESDEGRKKLDELERRQSFFTSRLNAQRDEIRTLAQKRGTDDLSILHNAKQMDLSRKQQEVENLQVQLTSITAMMDKPETGIGGLTDFDIARVDVTMAQLLQRQQSAMMQIDSLIQILGKNHRQVVDAQRQLELINANIKKYGDDFRRQFKIIIPGFGDQKPQMYSEKDIQLLRDRVDTVKKQFEKLQMETADIATDRYELDNKKSQMEKTRMDLDMVTRKFDQVNSQFQVIGQVKIISRGDLPTVPSIDRRKQMAVLGGLGGGAAPIALLLLIGLIDSRYRYSDDAGDTMSGIPLLGILPNLPDLLTDPEQAAMAAHCVHQIRTMLQISADSQDRRVFCVTSPSPGDGKTSLCLALGLSFATAGSRTLLIDLDLVGAGLTSRMNVNSPEGILEAISNRSLMPYVQSTDITDLSILPVGRASARHASMLSPAVVRKLVTEARNNYDTVLIDTGPILGSIEASPVCVSADAVILAVARGQQRPMVEKALSHLMGIGARLAGVVFNRAQARDFEQSVSRISMRSLRAPVNGNGHDAAGTPNQRRTPQLGPVARAVAKSVHANGDSHG